MTREEAREIKQLGAGLLALAALAFTLFGVADAVRGEAELPSVAPFTTCMELHNDYTTCKAIEEDIK